MKKTIKDYDLKGKKVIIRVDFNVPMQNGEITDDNRIKESLPTIMYAIRKQAKVILLSHLGRIKTEEDKEKYSLEPVALRLSELLNQEVIFSLETRGPVVEHAIEELQEGEVLLIENTRFEDYPEPLESHNDDALGTYWASLGDIFINDAFGTSHRSHASNVGIARHLPNGIGFLIEKELNAFEPILTIPKRPFTVILGGAKVKDKIGVIKNLVKTADYILIGGGMAYTFLKAQGKEIGKSIVEEENLQFCNDILRENYDKIVVPVDSVVSDTTESKEGLQVDIDHFPKDKMGVDIGPKTIAKFKEIIKKSNTIVANGPLGVYENQAYETGTKEILEAMSNPSIYTIIGGGDTAAAAITLGYQNQFTHISTGGGASLELLEGKKLPGIEIIEEK